MLMKKLFGLFLPALLVGCYSPEPFEAETVGSSASNQTSDIGTMFPVNTMQQICNPSVSQDTVNFPASMLWLNFGSDLYNRILNEAAEKSSDPQWKAEPYFLHHEDINICQLATQLSTDRYHLTEHKEEEPMNKEAKLQQEANRADTLRNQTEHMLLDFRMAYVEKHLKELQAEMSRDGKDLEKIKKLMADYKDMQQIRNALAKRLGNSIIL